MEGAKANGNLDNAPLESVCNVPENICIEQHRRKYVKKGKIFLNKQNSKYQSQCVGAMGV